MNEQERRSELGQFLRTHRERISPNLFGFPTGKRRRTPGLRREELAIIAGVGTTWYTWLEQGRDITVSVPILESLARVLQLDEDEQVHLFILARKQLPATPFLFEQFVDPTLHVILEAIGIYPAYVRYLPDNEMVGIRAICSIFKERARCIRSVRSYKRAALCSISNQARSFS